VFALPQIATKVSLQEVKVSAHKCHVPCSLRLVTGSGSPYLGMTCHPYMFIIPGVVFLSFTFVREMALLCGSV
jgi:hypothetical protein